MVLSEAKGGEGEGRALYRGVRRSMTRQPREGRKEAGAVFSLLCLLTASNITRLHTPSATHARTLSLACPSPSPFVQAHVVGQVARWCRSIGSLDHRFIVSYPAWKEQVDIHAKRSRLHHTFTTNKQTQKWCRAQEAVRVSPAHAGVQRCLDEERRKAGRRE